MSWKIIFTGTGELGVHSLEALLSDKQYEIMAVVTQPDRPAGRRHQLTPSPVKIAALSHRMPIYQPERISQIKNKLASLKAHVMVVVAFGQLLPSSILDLFLSGVVNIHPSLLPRYRGASPIQWALLNGERQTGVTIMRMDEKMDHGPIIGQQTFTLSSSETAGQLSEVLAQQGAKLLLDVLEPYLMGKITPQPQNENLATYCEKLTKESGRIAWTQPTATIERQIRAFQPWPGTFTFWHKKRLIIHQASLSLSSSDKHPGEVSLHASALAITCGDGRKLFLERLQLEGGKILSSQKFLRGYPQIIGEYLM